MPQEACAQGSSAGGPGAGPCLVLQETGSFYVNLNITTLARELFF